MRYFKLMEDYGGEDDVVCRIEDTCEFEQYDLKLGNFINNWNADMTFYFDLQEGIRFTDYLSNDMGWFLISKRFRNIIEELGVKAQFLPVNLVNLENNQRLDEYVVVNVLDVVDAINLDRSTYTVFEMEDEKIYNITLYALNENPINGKHIFKLKGKEIPIFVSQTFKQLVEENNITGCDFLEVEVVPKRKTS
jgi:hypothetical protein